MQNKFVPFTCNGHFFAQASMWATFLSRQLQYPSPFMYAKMSTALAFMWNIRYILERCV